MASVNVPEQKVPQALFELSRSNNKELAMLSKALIEYFEKDIFFEFQMWKRSGGSDDAIGSIIASDSFENSFSSAESLDRLDNLESLEDLIPTEGELGFSDVKTGSYTAVNGDWIESRGGTITLDKNAEARDEITVSIGSRDRTRILADAIKWKDQVVTCVESSRVGNSYTFKRFSYKDETYWRAI